MAEFVHLHIHSEFSLLDGANRIKELPKIAKKLGMDSIAITDHGVMYGAIEFYKAKNLDFSKILQTVSGKEIKHNSLSVEFGCKVTKN